MRSRPKDRISFRSRRWKSRPSIPRAIRWAPRLRQAPSSSGRKVSWSRRQSPDVKFLKRFNREQLTLGVAAILGVLLFGWQMTRSSGDTSTGELPKNDRFYGIGRQTTIEFVDTKVERYMVGRDIWEPPTAGRLPVPEIRPPEPRLGQITLPPLSPRPDDTEINKVSQPGKNRSLAAVVSPTPAPGFPSEAEITALKDLAEVDLAGRI